jgi:translation initiation factor 1
VVKGLKDRKDMKLLAKEIKTKVGTRGTYKDGQIVLQGDHHERVKNLLLQKGYNGAVPCLECAAMIYQLI